MLTGNSRRVCVVLIPVSRKMCGSFPGNRDQNRPIGFRDRGRIVGNVSELYRNCLRSSPIWDLHLLSENNPLRAFLNYAKTGEEHVPTSHVAIRVWRQSCALEVRASFILWITRFDPFFTGCDFGHP